MDFAHVLRALLEGFRAEGVDYALIGGFALALWNDPRREALDVEDIRQLMALHGTDLDWARIEAYFRLFGRAGLYHELRVGRER